MRKFKVKSHLQKYFDIWTFVIPVSLFYENFGIFLIQYLVTPHVWKGLLPVKAANFSSTTIIIISIAKEKCINAYLNMLDFMQYSFKYKKVL